MTAPSESSRLYCQNATDNQLQNIYSDESARVKRTSGDTKKAAKDLAQAAREELIRRGLM